MAVFTAYSDESGVGDPSGEFLVCGYVADETVWPWLIAAWQERVLDGPPKIPYFHMQEMRRPEWRQEHGTFNDAETRIHQAILVLYSTGSMSAIASVMKRRDMQEIFHSKFKRKKQVPIGLDEPDYMCYVAYISFILGEVRRKYRDAATKVNFVLAEKKKVTQHVGALCGPIKDFFEKNHPELSALLGDVGPGSMVDELPLQAADLLGWHMQKFYSKTYDRLEEGRFAMLVNDRDGFLHTWERRELEAMAKSLKLALPATP